MFRCTEEVLDNSLKKRVTILSYTKVVVFTSHTLSYVELHWRSVPDNALKKGYISYIQKWVLNIVTLSYVCRCTEEKYWSMHWRRVAISYINIYESFKKAFRSRHVCVVRQFLVQQGVTHFSNIYIKRYHSNLTIGLWKCTATPCR